MADLSVDLAGIPLRNPILTASGTFGYGQEYADLVPLDALGGIMVKGVSPFPSHGNPTPRTAEVFGGMLNAIGLQNPGLDAFIESPDYLPFLRQQDTQVFVNIWGKTVQDYVEVAERLDEEREGIAALEVNISCPNIKAGGIAFGTNLEMAAKVVSAVRDATTLPVVTKLSPNVSNIGDFARCVVDAGTDVVSLINTIPGMAIDVETRRPVLANITGGLSGPAIKPVAVRMVYEARRAVDVPIIGMGGIQCARDAVEFFLAGADAVAVGTAIFTNPGCLLEIIAGVDAYLDEHGCTSVRELVGAVIV
ncbi:MAG: dihydroorotate dehydrogenase [Lentisphaerae bacterium]|jgi:dihydroorotate dehydrogenase (NAD+) catalytic subunit|nr:dihydroorotate dehydrogenase [Lentisphaerota bacterium]MBT4816007.1 dihydroorotate dehydrogenase [Lentisphaerota bacterium]MBT5604530.1 dihydroorotate dehydrogenase [Lentisphaerota bacterium]MBT7061925.1 dihydroorotate dehydrogenase [Lentisphaerota bacterium]MBT7847925.1 dihydroorotate dehydrogenase [Lentisphaerota bacterium]